MFSIKYLPVVLLSIYSLFSVAKAYKPVIIIHGILDGASDLTELKSYIQTVHPGTQVELIDLFDYYESFAPLWQQVDAIRNITKKIMKSSKDGVNVIGYSQGGLVARGLIQTTDDHNVDTFIALSSPLNGQYGDTSWLSWFFPHVLKEELYSIFYTEWGQKWSIANYWKDPHKTDRYQEYSQYLAHLNDESRQKGDHQFCANWRNNFSRLKQLVLIGGPDDGVITPWQSALFGFFDENENIVGMRDQSIYKNDIFGLRKLDERKAINMCEVAGVHHIYWHRNKSVFYKCMEKYLQ